MSNCKTINVFLIMMDDYLLVVRFDRSANYWKPYQQTYDRFFLPYAYARQMKIPKISVTFLYLFFTRRFITEVKNLSHDFIYFETKKPKPLQLFFFPYYLYWIKNEKNLYCMIIQNKYLFQIYYTPPFPSLVTPNVPLGSPP